MGGRMVKVANSAEKEVFSFVRSAGGNSVFGIFNLSAAPRTVSFPETLAHGRYRDFAGGRETIEPRTRMTLPAWSYRLLAR